MRNGEVRSIMLERMEFYTLIDVLNADLKKIYDEDLDGDDYPSVETDRKEKLLTKLYNILGE